MYVLLIIRAGSVEIRTHIEGAATRYGDTVEPSSTLPSVRHKGPEDKICTVLTMARHTSQLGAARAPARALARA